ncbi:hypothetical protein EDB86DRAFT_2835944 [Lactarius hatsudake]|nr:hypothetical protein EDB86DRAFT_2835944 [Lactarius hatsudake]
MWWGVACCVGVAWGSVAGGGVLCAVSGWRGGQWQLGLVCHVEVVWQVGGVLACHVGSVRIEVVRVLQGLAHCVGAARWVGDGRVLGQDGGGSHARMACNVQGFVCCVGAVWRVGGGGMLGWGQQWPAMLKASSSSTTSSILCSHGDGPHGITLWW